MSVMSNTIGFSKALPADLSHGFGGFDMTFETLLFSLQLGSDLGFHLEVFLNLIQFLRPYLRQLLQLIDNLAGLGQHLENFKMLYTQGLTLSHKFRVKLLLGLHGTELDPNPFEEAMDKRRLLA
jgi:hypothetical protein